MEVSTRFNNQAAGEYKTRKAQEDTIARKASEVGEKENAENEGNDRLVLRLLKKVVGKISRSKKRSLVSTKHHSIQGYPHFRIISSNEAGSTTAGNKVVDIAEQLSLLNPTSIPTLGFKKYGGALPTELKLDDTWKPRFTNAADASFTETSKRGVATTSQEIDAELGTLTNVVNFREESWRVVVEGEPTSSTDIALAFKAVKIIRNSRFPRLFGQITIRLPSRLIRLFASRNTGGRGEEWTLPANSLC